MTGRLQMDLRPLKMARALRSRQSFAAKVYRQRANTVEVKTDGGRGDAPAADFFVARY
jgi:hypothetical protein